MLHCNIYAYRTILGWCCQQEDDVVLHRNKASARLVFKKYGKNRRLYDTSAKRYVGLEQVAAAVRKGTEVQVVEAETGEDLTRACLAQIIAEDAREKPAGLSLELLRQLITASDHTGREFIMWYLKSAFDAYHKVQSVLESGFSEVQSAAGAPLQLMKNFIQSRIPELHSDPDELQELRRRVAELEQRLAHSPVRGAKRGQQASEKKSRKPR